MAVPSVHSPGARLSGPPPDSPVTSGNPPRGRYSTAEPIASPIASPSRQPFARSRAAALSKGGQDAPGSGGRSLARKGSRCWWRSYLAANSAGSATATFKPGLAILLFLEVGHECRESAGAVVLQRSRLVFRRLRV